MTYEIIENGKIRNSTPAEDAQAETDRNSPISTPQTITRYQARIALIDAGKMGAVKAILNDPNADEKMVEAWMHKSVFDRDSDYINDMAAALGITQKAVDNLFKAGALIE